MTVNAPTFPANYLPGGLGVVTNPVVVPQHVSAGTPQNVYYQQYTAAQVPVTYVTVQQPPGVPQPANVTVTYVQQCPVTAPTQQYTLPMPDPQWSDRGKTTKKQTGQQSASLALEGNLTSDQKEHLMQAQPTTHDLPVSSVPQFTTTEKEDAWTKSERYKIFHLNIFNHYCR